MNFSHTFSQLNIYTLSSTRGKSTQRAFLRVSTNSKTRMHTTSSPFIIIFFPNIRARVPEDVQTSARPSPNKRKTFLHPRRRERRFRRQCSRGRFDNKKGTNSSFIRAIVIDESQTKTFIRIALLFYVRDLEKRTGNALAGNNTTAQCSPANFPLIVRDESHFLYGYADNQRETYTRIR